MVWKTQHLQWAAVLWVEMSFWWKFLEENSQTSLSWQKSYGNSLHPWLAEKHLRTQFIQSRLVKISILLLITYLLKTYILPYEPWCFGIYTFLCYFLSLFQGVSPFFRLPWHISILMPVKPLFQKRRKKKKPCRFPRLCFHSFVYEDLICVFCFILAPGRRRIRFLSRHVDGWQIIFLKRLLSDR